MVRVPLPLSVTVHDTPFVPFVTTTDVPSVHWMVELPSWLSTTVHDTPSLPFVPLAPLLPLVPSVPAGPAGPVSPLPPASATATRRTVASTPILGGLAFDMVVGLAPLHVPHRIGAHCLHRKDPAS